MIASLAMYDSPVLESAHDRYWSAIRSHLGHGPDRLDRESSAWAVWQSPDLLLSQTCGYPYRARLHGQVALVGTPDYALPGCPPGYYRSVLVARADAPGDLAAYSGKVFAYNEALSQSGWAGPMHHLQTHGVTPGAFRQTGGHSHSANAVVAGRADLAGIDSLTWELLQRQETHLTEALRVVAETTPTPGLPYITALGRDPGPISAAGRAAIKDISEADRVALHLRSFVVFPAEKYLAVPTPPPPPGLHTN